MTYTLKLFFLFFFCFFSASSREEAGSHSLIQAQLLAGHADVSFHLKDDSADQKLFQFYKERNFQPLWFENVRLNPAGQYALQALKNSTQEGLNPQDYQIVLKAFSLLDLHILSPEKITEYDALLTKYIIFYIQDLDGERLNPEKISKQLYIKLHNIDPYDILRQNMQEDSSGKWIADLTVSRPEYQKLKKILSYYQNIEQQGGWQNLKPSFEDQKTTLGTHSAFVEALKIRLRCEGYLKEEATNNVFDSSVEQALKDFQYYHGLDVDGKLGKETLNALNIPVKERIDQIVVSMERWRWLPQTQDKRYVLVNIAGYNLQAFEDEKKVLQMPVIIGRNYRQTPVFSSKIDFIRFNPSWYVPHSIAIKDKLPLLKSNPAYFNTKGYRIYNESGEAVDPEEMDWSDIDAASFNYRIIQEPGNANALGKMFFHINNPFDVFLHGTPDVELFKKAKRSFSSGCIRIFDPTVLAFFLFNNPEQWPLEKIIQLTQSNQTQTIPLKNPVDIYITYQTVWVDEQNQPYFFDDIYLQDKMIKKELEKKRTLFPNSAPS